MIDFETESQCVAKIASQIEHWKRSVSDEESALELARKQLEHVQQAQEILQLLAQSVQKQAHQQIAQVVSSCLSAVFDDPYEFHIQFERKRGKTEAVLRFRRNGLNIDPLTSSGGGVIDVAAFALRAACLVLHRPRLSKVLVLDEPFKNVSVAYRDNVRKMLEKLSKEMKIQIILVTHDDAFTIGKIMQL